jgi:hypothetical protein
MSGELGSIASFLTRAAQQTGFNREKYIEANIPKEYSDIVIFVFFGDYRAESIFSSLLFHQYIKKKHANKYVILCSWQGHAGLFPYVNEFWSIGDSMTTELLNSKAVGFKNNDPSYITITKNLRKFFDVLEWDDIDFYYQDGLTAEYFEHFHDLVKFGPALKPVEKAIKKSTTKTIPASATIEE